MNPFFDKIQRLANDSVQTGLSLVKIALFSKWKTPVPSVSGFSEELVILGNGPSLNTTIDEHYSFLENKTLLAVNFAGATPVFERLRPALYVIADPYFYSGTQQRATDLFRHIRETVTWDMVLFMPAVASGK